MLTLRLALLVPLLFLSGIAQAADPAAHYRVIDGIHLPDPAVTPGVAVTVIVRNGRYLLVDELATAAARAKKPGAATIYKDLCLTKWGLDKRYVSEAAKEEICRLYGLDHEGADRCPGPEWELDHLISRELAGADDKKNLFPQPIEEAHLKDTLENRLHNEVCDPSQRPSLSALEAAQDAISGNWYEAFKERYEYDKKKKKWVPIKK